MCGDAAEPADLDCEIASDLCCVPTPEPTSCEDAGGQCILHSPQMCGANAHPADLDCEIASDLCCILD